MVYGYPLVCEKILRKKKKSKSETRILKEYNLQYQIRNVLMTFFQRRQIPWKIYSQKLVAKTIHRNNLLRNLNRIMKCAFEKKIRCVMIVLHLGM